MNKTRSGFTIVELLIVIVVIAVLASVSIMAYSGVRSRAQDSQRLSNVGDILKGLNRYHILNGRYPSPTSTGGSWERSGAEAAGQFMEYLANYGFPSGVPLDPINNATTTSTSGLKNNDQYGYYYYRYAAGGYGCDASRGAFFVLAVTAFESTKTDHQQSPGFSCSGRNWQNEFSWVTGGFEN